ncbi:MAG: mechanosensitive ion channel [Actinomycetia bacterium]|nr:mechanosensitive ion channel [Actinomycetes bacterium]
MAVIIEIRKLGELLLAQIIHVAEAILAFLPSLIAASLAVLFGWILGKVLQYLINYVLEAVKFDELLGAEPINHEVFESAGLKVSLSQLLGTVIFWATFFFFGLAPAADMVNLESGRVLIERVIGFLPEVFGALLVLAAAFFIAGLLRNIFLAVMAPSNLRFLQASSWLIYAIFIVFGFGLALNVLGVAGSLVVDRFLVTVLLGAGGLGLTLAAAIGFGLGARDVFGAIIAGYQIRDRLAVGDRISIDDYSGVVEQMGLAAVQLRDAERIISIPNHLFFQKVILKKRQEQKKAA